MKELNDKQLLLIIGGAISGSLWSAVNKSVTLVSDLGRYLGSAIRRLINGRMCSY